MKTKVVQHVSRIKLDNMTTGQLDNWTTGQLDNWTTGQLDNFTGSKRLLSLLTT